MLKKLPFILILLVLTGCQKQSTEWNPVFEDTDFGYFNTEIKRSIATIDEAYSEAEKTNSEPVLEKLNQAKKRLLTLKDYYVPLTAIRQKIYDADRFYKLNKLQKSEKLLNEAKTILNSIELTTTNKTFDKVVLDLESMINEVIFSLNDDSAKTYDKMKKLGKHINLMLTRGDLILSGIKFNK